MTELQSGSNTASLVIRQRDQAERRIALHGESYRLGREGHLEIPLRHPTISRLHAVLDRDRTGWTLTDQNSTNGLW